MSYPVLERQSYPHYNTSSAAARHATPKQRSMQTTDTSPVNSVSERTVVVFDWDDTLCPSSWLHAQGLLPKHRGHQVLLNSFVQQVMQLVAEKVGQLLEKAKSYGPVFIVTAAECGWVELSCSLYMPSIMSLLNSDDIHIVSARSWFESKFGDGGDASHWKFEVMHLIASKCFVGKESEIPRGDCYFNLVSVGDSMAERDACHSAADSVPYTFAKTLKFVERPDIMEVAQQVELTCSSFDHMCLWGNHLDLRLTREQLDELRAC